MTFEVPSEFKTLHVKTAQVLSKMSDEGMRYATYLALAVYAGFDITVKQVSVEGLPIHQFILSFLSDYSDEELRSSKDLLAVVNYAAYFYENGGNYSALGDVKFKPKICKEKIRELAGKNPKTLELLDSCIDLMYDVEITSLRQLGINPSGTTAYYFPPDFTDTEVKAIDNFLISKGIKVQNTKLIRKEKIY